REFTSKRKISGYDIGVYHNVISGCLPKVFDSYPRPHSLAYIDLNNSLWVHQYSDIGAQLAPLRENHLPDSKSADDNESYRDESQKSGKHGNIGVSDSEIAYILMRPILFFFLRVCCTIFSYSIAAGLGENLIKNERWLTAIGLDFAVAGPILFVWGFISWII